MLHNVCLFIYLILMCCKVLSGTLKGRLLFYFPVEKPVDLTCLLPLISLEGEILCDVFVCLYLWGDFHCVALTVCASVSAVFKGV